MESPLRREAHGGFGERPGETDREQSRHRAPGRLHHVEQSFRMSKTDLAARPMFARTRDAIEAHLTIVFAALAVARTVQDRTGLSIRRFLRTIKPLRSATIEINGVINTSPPARSPENEALLAALTRH